MKKVFILFLVLLANLAIGQNYKFLVGTYTKKGSDGVYYCDFNTKSNSTKIISHSVKMDNPSFISLAKHNKKFFVVKETNKGGVSEMDFNPKSGQMKLVKTVKSGGDDPCYVKLDKTGKWIFVANYSSGTLSLIENKNGISEPKQVIKHAGSGPNLVRQQKPHVHCVNISPDNKYLLVADLGTDEVVVYHFNSKFGILKKFSSIKLAAGSGPRHLIFHPKLNIVYVIQELTGQISTLDFQNGQLKLIDEISTLPKDFTGNNSSADLHISPDAQFLYGSNRFYDTIASYRIDPKTGKLTFLEQTPVNGKTPRNFAITRDGKYVLVANQDSDNISIFSRNLETGKLTLTDNEIKVSMPVCIKLLH